jgi:hypothetical protein
MMYAPEHATLVYRDSVGNLHEQPVVDVVEVGTLIDPETGDDMEIIGINISNPRY